MKGKILWLTLSCLMVAALLLASCAPAEVEEEEEVATPEEEEIVTPEEEEVVTPEGKEMVRDSLGRLVEKPQYGGEFIFATGEGPWFFDEATRSAHGCWTLCLTNEELMEGDWSKGPGGTGEASFYYTGVFPYGVAQTGCLAESWEVLDDETIIYHIRKGVRWHDKPPANGREVVADDVVFSLMRLWQIPSSVRETNYPWEDKMVSMKALDKYTVEIKYVPGVAGPMHGAIIGYSKMVPTEIASADQTEWGSEFLTDWRNSIGTGPFMLVDYVDDSSVTFDRNLNYWGKDALHPENQLPYLEGVKWLIIPDTSTIISALRTHKIDWVYSMGWENAADIMKTNPELNYVRFLSMNMGILHWRVDREPFDDIRVRQALLLAVNNQEMADTLYGGEAHILTLPVAPIPEFMDIYTPLEELPESTRELYEYHPEKARQLLAEAGYPDGFDTSVICTSDSADMLSVIKAYWEKIGVDLELQVKEYAVLTGMLFGHRYDQMAVAYWVGGTTYFVLNIWQKDQVPNFSRINDPRIEEARVAMDAAYFNQPERRRIAEELAPYIQSQAWMLPFPGQYVYTFWTPRVKGYHGELTVGYYDNYNFIKYIWLDQDLE